MPLTLALTTAPAMACGKEGAWNGLHASAACPPPQAIDWQALSQLRIVFGHQSVGRNILNGIEQLAARDGVRINIRAQRMAPASPGINHFPIGLNGEPASKILDFAAAIDAGAAQGADVALMKLCYADFDAATDVQRVADDYIASLESLARKYPATRFVAVTVPLRVLQTGPKTWIKQLMGRLPGGYPDNATHAEFNARLRERYRATGRLFDLAAVESGTARVNGQVIEALRPELTHDGGHLNERGQALVATAFLDFIGTLTTGAVTK